MEETVVSEGAQEIAQSNGVNEKSVKEPFSFSSSPTLEDLRQMHSNFVQERNWEQFQQPVNVLLAMTSEVGEVTELFQWRQNVKEGLPDWTNKDKDHLAQELSDVLLYLLKLAEKCHIDLPKAAVEKIKLNKQKYPIEKVWGSSKKYTEYE